MSRWAARETATTLQSIVARARDEWIGFLAAAVAYYALVSLVPLVALIALAVVTVAGDTFAEQILAVLGDSLSDAGQEAVRRVLTTATARSQATVLGLVVLVWGGSRLFRGLDRAFGRVYGTDGEGDALGHARDAAFALVGVLSAAVAVGIVVAVVVAAAVVVATEIQELRTIAGVRRGFAEVLGVFGAVMGGIGSTVVQVVLLVVLLFPVYYILPNVPVTVREALPGTVLTAIGWTMLFAGFDGYITLMNGSALSGVLGGVVLVVTVLYASSFLLLLGAVVNAELAGM